MSAKTRSWQGPVRDKVTCDTYLAIQCVSANVIVKRTKSNIRYVFDKKINEMKIRGVDSYTHIHKYTRIKLCALPPSGTQLRKDQESLVIEGRRATTCIPKQGRFEVVQSKGPLNCFWKTINWLNACLIGPGRLLQSDCHLTIYVVQDFKCIYTLDQIV